MRDPRRRLAWSAGGVLLLVAGLGALACSDPTGLRDGVSIQTGTEYAYADSAGSAWLNVGFAVRNESGRDVYLATNCYSHAPEYQLEMWDGEAWVPPTSLLLPILPFPCEGSPVKVEPGRDLESAVQLVTANSIPWTPADLAGTYRLRLDSAYIVQGRPLEIRVPLTALVSEPFRVVALGP